MAIITQTTNTIDFSDIFHYAAQFGVSWNPANDLFFGNLFDYGSIDYVDYAGDYEGASVEEISSMNDDTDKAQAIFDHFVDHHNLQGATLVDSK